MPGRLVDTFLPAVYMVAGKHCQLVCVKMFRIMVLLHLLWRRLHPEFRIYAIDADEFGYREGDHQLRIFVTPLAVGDARGDIWFNACSTVRWASPHDDELIPDAKRQLILQRLVADLKKKDKWSAYVVYSDQDDEYERRRAEDVRKRRRNIAGS
jgi:hypothetical protein